MGHKGLVKDSLDARCRLWRSGSRDSVLVIGWDELERIPAFVPQTSFVLPSDIQPGIDNHSLCLLLKHHRRIHWETLNVEPMIVSGRIYTNVV